MRAFLSQMTPRTYSTIARRRAEYGLGETLPSRRVFSGHIGSMEKALSPVSFKEKLDIVDTIGNPTGYTAPRWYVHLFGLRHNVVRVLLLTEDGKLVLQRRSGQKPGVEGTFDLSAGGHVQCGMGFLSSAKSELEEELGLKMIDLVGETLFPVGPIHPVFVSKPEHYVVNNELTRLFCGRVKSSGLERISFMDGEVSGIFTQELDSAHSLVNSPLAASSFRSSFPVFMQHYSENIFG